MVKEASNKNGIKKQAMEMVLTTEEKQAMWNQKASNENGFNN